MPPLPHSVNQRISISVFFIKLLIIGKGAAAPTFVIGTVLIIERHPTMLTIVRWLFPIVMPVMVPLEIFFLMYW